MGFGGAFKELIIDAEPMLQDAARNKNKESYAKFQESAMEGAKQCTLRGQMDFKYVEKPLDVSEVEDATSIVKRFVTGNRDIDYKSI